MKINKIILRIAHLFGYMMSQEHIDDVTTNIPLTQYTKEEQDYVEGLGKRMKAYSYMAETIKTRAYEILKANPELEKKCRRVFQLWLTFYKSEQHKKDGHGSITIMLYYRDGILYFPCSADRTIWRERKVQWDIEDGKIQPQSVTQSNN
jgi:hypothetical protein